MTVPCQSCGTANPPGSSFCHKCGNALAAPPAGGAPPPPAAWTPPSAAPRAAPFVSARQKYPQMRRGQTVVTVFAWICVVAAGLAPIVGIIAGIAVAAEPGGNWVAAPTFFLVGILYGVFLGAYALMLFGGVDSMNLLFDLEEQVRIIRQKTG